ncbi:MAG TPA: hypothetical protein DHU55_02330 [Blastocatellia bacterium]|jgi:signal transduction histidine kinase|nr:hypothetical protein [Blastocatellia bacterium]HCX28599.1 hypothetical protein [Blastocatellia bacterium]
MEELYNTEHLLALRKSTRAIADLLRNQMKVYLSTLAPLFRPRNVLGNYAQGGTYEASRTGEKPFKELQELYQSIAQSKLYQLPSELKTPLEVINTQLEMTPVEYMYVANSGGDNKSIVVTSPLKWALTYRGFGPGRFREVIDSADRSTDQLQQFVLHYLMMHSVVAKQPGLSRILEDLHFPVNVEYSPEFGDLPLTYVASSISTIRPPDEVLVESTEVSGTNAFEEIVQLEDIPKLRDPLKEQLLEITKSL